MLYCIVGGPHSPTPEPAEVVTSPTSTLQPPRLTPRCFVDYDRKKEEAEKGGEIKWLFDNQFLSLPLSLAKTSKIEAAEPRKPTKYWSGYNFSESWAPGEVGGAGGGASAQMRAPQGLSSLNKVE